jgi:hypothetical protein
MYSMTPSTRSYLLTITCFHENLLLTFFGGTDIGLKLCCDLSLLLFSDRLESHQNENTSVVRSSSIRIFLACRRIRLFYGLLPIENERRALNVDRVSPGDVLDTELCPIPVLAKGIAVVSAKLCRLGSPCFPCIRILDGPDILTSTP